MICMIFDDANIQPNYG